MLASLRPLGLSFFVFLVSTSAASAAAGVPGQCTSCDGVKVTFRAAMCAEGDFFVQLHNNSLGPIDGLGCAVYTSSPTGKVTLKPEVAYTLLASGNKVGTAHLKIEAPSCYTVFIDGEETNTVDVENLGCTTYAGSWTVVLKSAALGGSGSGGQGGVSAGSSAGGLSGDFSLGGALGTSPLGSLSFSSGTISPDLFTTAALIYQDVSPEVEVIHDGASGSLRQIMAPELLADIVTLSPSSYELRFYPQAQVGAKSNGLFTVTGSPSRIWRFSSPTNNTAAPEILVTEIQGTVQSSQTFSMASGIWMAEATAARRETRSETTLANGDSQIETTITHPSTSLVASKVQDIYHAFPWGTEIISSKQDPTGDQLLTTRTYYTDPADPSNYTRLKTVTLPDGSWRRYEYYDWEDRAAGEIEFVYRPWKDLPALPSAASKTNCHLTKL